MSRGDVLTTALLFLASCALGASVVLPALSWPGVSLAALSLAPWGWEAWLSAARPAQNDGAPKWEKEADALIKSAWKVTDLEGRLEEQGQQINSLRNAASMRGTFGG